MRQGVLRPADVAVALALARSPGQGYEPLAESLGISISTAHQAVRRLIAAEDRYVWPSARRDVRGAAIPPALRRRSGAPRFTRTGPARGSASRASGSSARGTHRRPPRMR